MNAAGNLAPERVAALYAAVQKVDLQRARDIHVELFRTEPVDLYRYQPRSSQIHDVPAWFAPCAGARLPLVSIDDANAKILDGVLARAGLLKAS